MSARFRPTRAGIINLWDYRDDEFVFADGRLVLRGPNGSGKTKALEVLFPFVFDGRIEPRRLNPFASEDRTMRSNLLYRGQSAGYGYVWMEFATEGGEAVTVGIGLQGSRHSDKVKRWYFVVDGRVGVDFSLLTADDRPLTRKQLLAELGAEVVCDTPQEHRTAVDARLFGLGRERFEQLLTLVLTLRRPQLAKNLDPVSLSDTLSDGLRPLDDHLLVEAARSFDDMESVARTLDGLVRADEAAGTFLSAYTAYLRVQARTAADRLTVRRDAVTEAARRLAAGERALAGACDSLTAAEDRARAAGTEVGRGRARLEELKASEGFRAHQDLIRLAGVVQQLEEAATVARKGHADAVTARGEAETDAARAVQNVARLTADTTRAARDLAEEALTAGITWSATDAAEEGLPTRATARRTERDADIVKVRESAQRLERAEHDRRTATTAFEESEAVAAEAATAERLAEDRVAAARTAARQRMTAWADRHPIAVDTPGLLDALAATIAGAGEPDAADPRTVFADLTAEQITALRDDLVGLRRDHAARTTDLTELRDQRERIAAERDDAPSPVPTRSASRSGRAGAPLWQLVRFADGVGDREAAGIEAGLEAAALLDAWIHHDADATAAALTSGDADGYLAPLPVADRPAGPTLADVLIPDGSDQVPDEQVHAVLASIALLSADAVPASGAAAVSRGGRFAQGVQVGAYSKESAGFVGAAARARRRAARLAELDVLIARLGVDIGALDTRITVVEQGLEAAAAAARDLPKLGDVVAAVRVLAEAAGAVRSARDALDIARGRLDAAIAEAGTRERELRRTEAEHRLSADDLDTVVSAVARFSRTADHLAAVYISVRTAERASEDAAERLTKAVAMEDQRDGDARTAEDIAGVQVERLATLRATDGAAAEQVVADMAKAEAAFEAAQGRLVQATKAREAAVGERATAAAEQAAAIEQLRVGRGEQQVTARELEPFAEDDVLRLLRCPAGLRWPARSDDWPDPATGGDLPVEVVALHDAILAATGELRPTEATVKQASTRLSRALDELRAELSAAGHEHRPEWDGASGIVLVRVVEESGPVPIGAFGDRISADRRDQEQLLTESERRVLEDALLTQLARQIHERTVDARDLIARMNAEMRSRRMSSGITVGVRWEIADGLVDSGREIVKLMEVDSELLGPDDLARMRTHFASSIKNARAVRPDRSYRELLADVLDYRRWRTFSFQLHPAGGGEERLTRARHGRLSGGEQSVSLHLPLFAAAHAMFDSADPACPRLLALDEAFAGVDDTGRTELFGLSTEFDFDLIMTGYDLWATYTTVSAAAHYDLSHSAAEHAVSALLMVWDGKGTDADFDGTLASALGSPLTRRPPGAVAEPLGADIDEPDELDE